MLSILLSILGSGWLGLPLAGHFASMGHHVKASATSEGRLPELLSLKVEPFIVDIRQLSGSIQDFLQAHVLIINIPSKSIEDFRNLLNEIELSGIEKVIFVSSTSVYEDRNKALFESDGEESSASPLLTIENLFRSSRSIAATIVRFGGLIGYDRNPGNFFRGGRIIQNPDAPVNLIHRDDCIGIISRIVEQEVWGEVFNCCADTHPTKREFYAKAAKSIGAPVPECAGSGAPSFKIISNEKVKRLLNYEFVHPDLMKIDLEKGG
jgi:nucleoside-diphosphate-sugar epimerase